MKNDIGYFYDTEEVIDLKNFTELFIVMLAKKEKPFYYEKKSKKTAEIPTNYKQSIELVMHAENSCPSIFLN